MVVASSALVVWIICRVVYLRQLSYSTESLSYFAAIKAKICLSVLMSLLQLCCGFLPVISGEYDALVSWLLLLCYIVTPTTGWVMSTYMMVLQHRTRLYSQEYSQISFWSYYSAVQFAMSISKLTNYMRNYSVTMEDAGPFPYEIWLSLLHFLCFAVALAIIVINRCGRRADASRLPGQRGCESEFSIADLSSLLPADVSMRVPSMTQWS